MISEELWTELREAYEVDKSRDFNDRAAQRFRRVVQKAAKALGCSYEWNEVIDRLDALRPDWRGHEVEILIPTDWVK